MIQHLRYAVSFPTNGVVLNGDLSLQPGSTAISGRNGTGKSFIAEMIRYGLFGKKALRGPAADYKTLDMSMTFCAGDTSFTVARGKKETLTDQGHETLAIGADAVNKKIVDILGFELEVFDVVCAANQKESERLTRLTPLRRKELIDEVVGLTAQEAVEKACREEANALRRETEVLTRTLVLPEEPVKPEGYRPSQTIKDELDETKATVARRTELQRIVDSVGEAPVEPEKTPEDVEKLELHEQARTAQDATRATLQRQLNGIPEPKHTAAQLNAADALAEYDAEVARRGPEPSYHTEQLDYFYDILDAQKLVGENVTCPKCQHGFHPGLTEEQELLARDTSPLTRDEIDEQCEAYRRWATPLIVPKGKRLTAEERSVGRMALALAANRPQLVDELAALPTMKDKSAALTEARLLDRVWDIYERDSISYLTRVSASADAKTELDQLPVMQSSVAELDAAFVAARVYETQLANYSEQRQRFDDLTAEIGAKQQRSEEFIAGAKGLVEARRTLKAFLAPSLSRVASKLITQMTENAERPLTEIYVDEDMNISADGQDCSTFNGAHATMINLALRLALGQVLVAKVFPVFIGDEIDSDADEANSQAVADALSACKEQLKQIVIISHKRLEGVDHEVML